ncbi:6-phosphogluconolactonase [Solirhodobacter olei]|uniref:6-phosphogluconolactonase n=1 Tax=Solirhodobacter olei TaxID=2493082 RepID=UPI000FD9BFAD|nr:6-phosphogluconolactonase [Solirhodobacter olei]
MNLIEYPDRDLMYLAVANKVAGQLGDFLRRNQRASLCVPGGTTPGPVFDVLSDVDLDWSRVGIFLSDERWVPESSPRSNTRLIRDRLLVNKAEEAALVPMHIDTPTPEQAIEALQTGLEPWLPISVLILGMGGDMHTASLFPGADRLAEAMEANAPMLMPMRAEGAEEPRLTLTAPVLAGALATHLVIVGAEKRAALEKAQGLDSMQAPIRAFLGEATVHWAE